MCLPQVALPVIDACAGSVLTPHDHITNVQKRLGNRTWRGFGQCRLCGSFLDPQLEHGETCSTTEAPRMRSRRLWVDWKLADPGISMEPRGLTATQSRPADLFTTAAVPGRSAALDVSVASPNAAAARGDAAQAAFDRKLSDYRQEIPDLRNQGIHCRPFVWTGGRRPHPVVTRTLQCAADVASSRDGRIRFNTGGNTKLFRQRAAMTRAVLPSGSSPVSLIELCITGAMFLLSTVELETTITQAWRETRPYQTTMTTSPPSPVNRLRLCSHQVSRCACPVGQFSSAFLTFPGDLELDALFEDHGVSCTVIEDMVTLERAVYQRCTPGQRPLSDRQMFNR